MNLSCHISKQVNLQYFMMCVKKKQETTTTTTTTQKKTKKQFKQFKVHGIIKSS